MKFSLTHSALALSLATAIGGAHATTLTVNSIVGSVDVVAAAFGGTLLDSAITVINNASYNGVARTAVYDTGAGLDFYYQFSNDISSANGVERFSGYDFSSLGNQAVGIFQTSAAFDSFLAGTEPSDGADRTGFGVIGMKFLPNGASKINPGTTSYTQIIRTTATRYQAGNFGLLNGHGDNALGFAPAIPEPSSALLLLAGLSVLGAFVWRRQGSGRTSV